jgi:retinol dehydrogenase-13
MNTNRQNTKQTALVTGGTGAIGRAIVKGLIEKNYAVTLVAKDAAKARRVAAEIQSQTGTRPEIVICELSSHSQIISIADNWNGPLHILVNNAAVCPVNKKLSAEGIEMQFATNVLGYTRMMNAFADIMQKTGDARIVNVASYWAGGLNINDLEFKNRPYDNDTAYRQSKQANRMLTMAFAKEFKSRGITVNSCHPGEVRSRLASDLGFGGHETPEQGAATPVFIATSDSVKDITGSYFYSLKKEHCHFCDDTGAVFKLYNICNSYS